MDSMDVLHLMEKEIRFIEASKMRKLASIIDSANDWCKLLEELTKPTSGQYDDGSPLFSLNLSLDAINLIEKQSYCEKSPSLALLNHWAITGRRRPTVKSLITYLRSCNLRRAEDYVCRSILGIEPNDPVNLATYQYQDRLPVENIPNSSFTYDIDKEFKFDNLDELVDGLETKCSRYSFRSIYDTTNGFCHKPFDISSQKGAKIGEGRFSSVFRAKTQPESSYPCGAEQTVAAKLLKSECNKKYLANEINLIGRVHHTNILELLGIALGESSNGSLSYICLVYPYMQNGSLLDCLTSGIVTRHMEFLTWDKRVEIAIKVAKGITYLHTFHEGPIIHRDIKTANILIDSELEPKVGDFTLVRQLDTIRATETQFSQNVIGTSVYMPPEAFRGDISIKFDTFSYGIVVLELLTGMRPFNEELDEDLFTYINEALSDIDDESDKVTSEEVQSTIEEARDKFLREILDKKAGKWNFDSSKVLFHIALQATESRKKQRPEMSNLLPILESIQHVNG